MNGYNLIRSWYDFKFENPSKAKAIHSDMYCYIVDLWNRLGQKKEFGLPTSVTMELLGIGSYNTFKKTLDDLIQFGFIKIISESKNQHQSKIVALSEIDKATDKALDKANTIASDKATDTIDKQLNNKTNKQINNASLFNFRSALLSYGFDSVLIDEWLRVRKNKKLTNTETAFNKFIKQVELNGNDKNEILEKCIEKSWGGFESDWLKKEIKEVQKVNTYTPIKLID